MTPLDDAPGVHTSHARRVMTRKSSYASYLDDFPTPPWAVRAFFRYVLPVEPAGLHFLDPGAGRGHVVRTVSEYDVASSLGYDRVDYGYGFPVADYVDPAAVYPAHDVVLTNPPYKLSEEFLGRALGEARVGVGLLLRTIWLEGRDRYRDVFSRTPPSLVVTFARRMHSQRGRVVRKSGAMMSHSWFWWSIAQPTAYGDTRVRWIPPGTQAELELPRDYE